MARGDDEVMHLPTWRVRQLQDIEDAALAAVELSRGGLRQAAGDPAQSALLIDICELLVGALESHQ